jgi:hypothetical protein
MSTPPKPPSESFSIVERTIAVSSGPAGMTRTRPA